MWFQRESAAAKQTFQTSTKQACSFPNSSHFSTGANAPGSFFQRMRGRCRLSARRTKGARSNFPRTPELQNSIHRTMKTATLLVLACLAGISYAAEKKRVIVCTVTTGFRHSSIAEAEKTLEKLAKESGAFEIVEFAQQPDVAVPKRPNKPKDLAPTASDKD